jgi:hypothetical protein
MQRAHGGHKADALARAPGLVAERSHFGRGIYGEHGIQDSGKQNLTTDYTDCEELRKSSKAEFVPAKS